MNYSYLRRGGANRIGMPRMLRIFCCLLFDQLALATCVLTHYPRVNVIKCDCMNVCDTEMHFQGCSNLVSIRNLVTVLCHPKSKLFVSMFNCTSRIKFAFDLDQNAYLMRKTHKTDKCNASAN